MFPIGRTKGTSQDKGRKRPLLRSHLLPVGTALDGEASTSTGMLTATAPSAVASDLSSSMFVRKAVPLRNPGPFGTPTTGVSSVHRSNTVPAQAPNKESQGTPKECSKSAETRPLPSQPVPPRRLLPVPAYPPAPTRPLPRSVSHTTPKIDALPLRNQLRRTATDTWDTRTSTQLSTMRTSSMGSLHKTEDESDESPQPTPIANKYLVNTAIPGGDNTAVPEKKCSGSVPAAVGGNTSFDINFTSPTFEPNRGSKSDDIDNSDSSNVSNIANVNSARPTFSDNPEYLWELEDFQKRRDDRNHNAKYLVKKTEDEKRYAERRSKLLMMICCVLMAVLVGITVGMSSTIQRLERANQKQESLLNHKQFNDTQKSDYGGKLPIGIDTLADAAKLAAILSDTSLHNILYGVGYAPQNVMTSHCGVNQTEVTLDVAVLSRVTNRIRLYGTGCDQALYVLRAIDSLKVPVKVALGVWINGNPVVCAAQIAEAIAAVEEFPHLIESIMVGNEVFFRGELSPSKLVHYITEVRSELEQRNLTIPIGTSELGSQWSPYMASNVDVLGANIHPFFGGLDVPEATNWTLNFLESFVINEITDVDRVPQVVISEIGWPSGGGQHGAAISGVKQQQRLLQDWICTAKELPQIGWYWFEAFDEPWKHAFDTSTEKWESQWGIFTPERRLKRGLSLNINC